MKYGHKETWPKYPRCHPLTWLLLKAYHEGMGQVSIGASLVAQSGQGSLCIIVGCGAHHSGDPVIWWHVGDNKMRQHRLYGERWAHWSFSSTLTFCKPKQWMATEKMANKTTLFVSNWVNHLRDTQDICKLYCISDEPTLSQDWYFVVSKVCGWRNHLGLEGI